MISSPTALCRPLPLLLSALLTFAVFSVHAAEIADSRVSTQGTQLAMLARPVAINAGDHAANKMAPDKKSKHTAKRLANKALKPLRATIVQLGRPLEWLNSARHHIWPSTMVTAKETFYLERFDSPRLLNINVSPQSMFSLGSALPAASTRAPVHDYELPNDYAAVVTDRVTGHASATELQVRMAEYWSMLYVLDRTNTDLNNYTVSVGLGLRHSF